MKLSYLNNSSKDNNDKKRRRKIQLMFTSAVFFVLFITYLLIMTTLYILISVGVLNVEIVAMPGWLLILIFSISSFLIGSILTFFIGKFVLNAVNTVAEGMNALSKGNFDVRIDLGRNEESRQVANCFNNLAQELKGIQMLRSNFINEYAHEFKTPIVSIKGFAELLKEKDLTEEQRKEYLDVIVEESNRLSTLASNSLNLSKIENQRIITDLSKYNLSEQIRDSLLLLEKNWQEKDIELQINFDEYYITANEELLKQVWINLIDNAIKFSDQKGSISIELYRENDNIIFTIENRGKGIAEEDLEKIFEKYYRSSNCSPEGHGVGLAVVKKIVQLHNGEIKVNSQNNITKFSVSLPLKIN